jgi:hypothetical protein
MKHGGLSFNHLNHNNAVRIQVRRMQPVSRIGHQKELGSGFRTKLERLHIPGNLNCAVEALGQYKKTRMLGILSQSGECSPIDNLHAIRRCGWKRLKIEIWSAAEQNQRKSPDRRD